MRDRIGPCSRKTHSFGAPNRDTLESSNARQTKQREHVRQGQSLGARARGGRRDRGAHLFPSAVGGVRLSWSAGCSSARRLVTTLIGSRVGYIVARRVSSRGRSTVALRRGLRALGSPLVALCADRKSVGRSLLEPLFGRRVVLPIVGDRVVGMIEIPKLLEADHGDVGG